MKGFRVITKLETFIQKQRTLLQQEDYQATIWIICLLGTQDEKWIESALERFDKSKVEYINYKNLK